MTDIFLSYNREDQARAKLFAEAFQAQGFKVWWDVGLRTGEAYDQVTEKALREAKAVVVLWSKKSVDSRWVRAEATIADRNKTLVPAMIEPCDRPVMFELTQTAELTHWQGAADDKAWLAFLGDVRRFVGREPGQAAPGAMAPLSALAPAATPSSKRSIVVLPFANMSGDPEQEYFADGISEDIITDLSKVSALAVIARNSAFTFKGKNVDILQVAKQLKVTHVLEGSVRKAGNRVRITAQLIDGATNDHVWAERFDRNLDDIFALQDEISEAIVKALKVQLFPEEKKAIESRGTNNVEAYDIYLRAQDLSRQFGPGEAQRALALYRRAVELDPQFALAWAGLGVSCVNLIIRAPRSAKATFVELDKALLQTAAAAPGTALGHVATGLRLTAHQDWLGAEAAYAAARTLASPRELSGLPGGAQYTWFLSNAGRFDEAIEVALRNLSWDPLSVAVSATSQYMLDGAGRYAEAEREYQRSLDLTGDQTTSHYWALLRAWESGAPEQIAERTRLHFVSSGALFAFYPELENVLDTPDAALAIIRSAVDDPACQDASRQSILAHWAARFGDTDLALAALRRAFVDYRGVTTGNIWFPVQKATRQLPGFKDLVRDLGLYDFWRKSGHWGNFARPLGDDDFEVIG